MKMHFKFEIKETNLNFSYFKINIITIIIAIK